MWYILGKLAVNFKKFYLILQPQNKKVMPDNFRYNQRGVSASKEDVHNAIKNIDKGLYPKSFCKIIPDILCGDNEYCNIMHADGAGTKSSLAYMYWRETGDLSVWKGIAIDAIVTTCFALEQPTTYCYHPPSDATKGSFQAKLSRQ